MEGVWRAVGEKAARSAQAHQGVAASLDKNMMAIDLDRSANAY